MNEEDPPETPDVAGAYPRLSEEQIELLSRRGEQRPVQRGELLVAEGQRDRDFVVVLSGKVAVIEGYGTSKARLVRVHGPRRFLDELGLLTGQPSFVSMVAQEPGRVLAVALPGLHELVREEPDLGDLVLRSFLARRELLIGGITGIKIVGSRFSPDTRRLETSRPGVLAVGDVRSGSIKRVASAVGEGSMAIRLIHEHLARFGHAADRQRSRT